MLYKVVMCAQRMRKDMCTHLSFAEATSICEYYGWEIAPEGEGSFVWDLDIEEE